MRGLQLRDALLVMLFTFNVCMIGFLLWRSPGVMQVANPEDMRPAPRVQAGSAGAGASGTDEQSQRRGSSSSSSSTTLQSVPGPCEARWEDTIPGYSILTPFHGHVNYTAFFAHYNGFARLDRFFIVWSNKGEAPPLAEAARFKKVVIIEQESDSLHTRGGPGALPIDYSLNNRFRPYESIRTEAVFSLDNDLLVPENYLERVYDAWLLDPQRIVGFSMRLAAPSEVPKYRGKYEIWWPDYSHARIPGQSLAYNLVFTNAAMLHRDLLNEYTCRAPAALRQRVEELRSCEDIAMNLLAYRKWRKPPLAMVSRSRCINNNSGAPFLQRDTEGLAKKGDQDSYALFRGKCYSDFGEMLNTSIPTTNIVVRPYDDRLLCSNPPPA
eukprot:m.303077 g.303077  ORF g.303077 m.303077 type:complete len:382 (+) comp15643_c0_seq1:80-1225(+)